MKAGFMASRRATWPLSENHSLAAVTREFDAMNVNAPPDHDWRVTAMRWIDRACFVGAFALVFAVGMWVRHHYGP